MKLIVTMMKTTNHPASCCSLVMVGLLRNELYDNANSHFRKIRMIRLLYTHRMIEYVRIVRNKRYKRKKSLLLLYRYERNL
jgi:hypothetical protein